MSGGAWFWQAVELALSHRLIPLLWIPYFVLTALVSFLSRSFQASIPTIVAELAAQLALAPWVSAVTLYFLEAVSKGQTQSLSKIIARGLRRAPSLIGLYVIQLLLLGVASLVPGALAYFLFGGRLGALVFLLFLLFAWFVFLLVRLALAEAALVLGDRKIVESINESWFYTRRAFAPVLGLYVRLLPILVLGALLRRIPAIGPLFEAFCGAAWAYLATAGAGYAYLELRSATEAGPSPVTPPSSSSL